MSRKEDEYLIERMGKLLAEIAIIVNGLPPSNISWSYHDLPEKVRALKEAQQPAAAVPEGYLLIESSEVESICRTLERDGDEYGIASLLRDALSAAAERKGETP